MACKPLVSVITPTYNRPKKIIEAVDTVRNQSYPNVEHIIVDGNSEESIDEIVYTHVSEADTNLDVTVEIQSGNEGVCAARNRGMELADGKYIAFLDDDDEWYTEKTTRQVNLAESSDAGIIYTGVEQIEADQVFATQIPNISGDCTKTLLTSSPLKTPSTIMISQDVFRQSKGFDTEIEYFEDTEFYLRVSKYTTVEGVNDVLVTRYNHDSQRSNNYHEIKDSVKKIMSKHQKLAQKYDVEKKYEAMWEALLGGSAVNAAEYRAARRHYFNVIKNQPSIDTLIRLFALAGGERTYRPLKKIRRKTVSSLQ